MKITKLKINHLVNPVGYALDLPFISWVTSDTSAKKQVAARVVVKKENNGTLTADGGTLLYDSGKRVDISSLGYELPVTLEPHTRYFWQVHVWGDNGDFAESDWAFFETAKLNLLWEAQWIRGDFDKDTQPYLRRNFNVPGEIQWARVYACGLGLYELEINGGKAGEEYLMPGYHAYDSFVQYQTYDVTELLRQGDNTIAAMLAPGWYKGRFVFEGGFNNIYGDTMEFICELRIKLKDGTELKINSDGSWKGRSSPVKTSSIYDGEEYNALEEISEKDWIPVKITNRTTLDMKERINPPLLIHERLKPVEIITTSAGETVLDFGQEITGWVSFLVKNLKPGATVKLSYSEIMQDGLFYRDNLRSAKAEYVYMSNGGDAFVRPHFTFFGFRYVKVEGIDHIEADDFTANALYSDIERCGWIETANPEVNRLIENILWSQKDNFLDIPTDCPQRDERMGWTGDAAVFCETANQNMYTPAFFNHYIKNIEAEQNKFSGAVPLFVPTPKLKDKKEKNLFLTTKKPGISVWGDAGSMVPWALYVMYGNKTLLRRHYGVIKDWAEYIMGEDAAAGGMNLWKTGMHLGDWLSLDKEDTQNPMGSTDVYYIASAFYYNTVSIAAKAASVLGLEEDHEKYHTKAEKIKAAFIAAYYQADGKLAITETQTALAVALYFKLYPEGAAQTLLSALVSRLKANGFHLDTGFVGTPLLCLVLSEYGAGDAAYSLFLQKTYPSWLYEVGMGATTIWERWNSVLPDGKISGTNMNSLNHYAYGSIGNWLYRHVGGLNPIEECPGYKKVIIAPQPDRRLGYVHMIRDTAAGRYEVVWKTDYTGSEESAETGGFSYTISVPFDCEATVLLPGRGAVQVGTGTYSWRSAYAGR
jgi:alpha-L-rhamnosidase